MAIASFFMFKNQMNLAHYVRLKKYNNAQGTFMSQSAHKYSLTARIFIGMATGILTGVLLQLLFDDSGDFTFSIFGLELSTYNILVEGIFSTLGQIFIASLKMLVVPLVFVSLICGTSTCLLYTSPSPRD